MPNSLINETSPYLLQHAHNPVDWHAWNPAALEKAKKENKMLLISIGYAACHWCHVMEHECFESEEVAKVMNDHYICIKVDREERPDVDQVYMNAAYLINGNGGWPLNALALPDGKPFFAGTYFPRENWIKLLEYFAQLYTNEPRELEEQAGHLAKGIRDMEHIPLNVHPKVFDQKDLDQMYLVLEKRIDPDRGGMKGTVKFPMPSVWEFLLQYHYFSGNREALKAVETTLDYMARGGIYDHVGGGFSRYSTDPGWHAPHFEKMLYDNGQLVSLYSHAFQVTKNPLYQKIVYETLAFVKRELASPEGGFYSSLDADSEGEEGKYYVWSRQEINEILKEDAESFSSYYGITNPGNWEGQKNIPDVHYGRKAPEDPDTAQLDLFNRKLLAEREKRIPPATDDKILTSWNALMAIGYTDAYRVFEEEEFFTAAKGNIDFILKNLYTEAHSLYRNYKNGKATIHAFLDDYAFFISALIAFYQVSFEESYLLKARELMDYAEVHFYDKDSGMFLYTDDQYSDLIARKMEVTDNVIPSSNSQMAKNLFLLDLYFDYPLYREQSVQLLKNVTEEVSKNPGYYSNWAQAMIHHIFPVTEIAITGKDWKAKLAEFGKNYLPDVTFSGGDTEGSLFLLSHKLVSGKTMIYVCKNRTCQQPVEKVSDAWEQI